MGYHRSEYASNGAGRDGTIVTQATPSGRTLAPPSQMPHVLGLIALAALPLLVLAAASAWRAVKDAEAHVADERVSTATAAALVTARFVDGNLSTVRTIALSRSYTDPDSYPEALRFFERVLAENPDWEGMGLADQDGWNIASTGGPPRTRYIGDRPYFQEVMATGRAAVSPVIVSRRTGQPTITLVAPVQFDAGGRGVLIVSLSTDRLAQELQAVLTKPGLEIVVLDSEGQPVVHPDRATALALAPVRGRPEVDAALAGATGSLRTSGADGVDSLVAYAPVPSVGWAAVVSQPAAQALALVQRQLFEALVLLTTAAALTACVGWYLG